VKVDCIATICFSFSHRINSAFPTKTFDNHSTDLIKVLDISFIEIDTSLNSFHPACNISILLFNASNSQDRFCAITSKCLEFSTIFSKALLEFSKETADLLIISFEVSIFCLYSSCQTSKFFIHPDNSLKLSQS
jgi:hypothetical protein